MLETQYYSCNDHYVCIMDRQNIVWVTCGLQERLGMVNFHQVYLCMIVSVILGLVLTAVLPGTKPGYFRLSKEEKAAC